MPGPFSASGPPDSGQPDSAPIEMVEYRREWPARFLAERERLAAILGENARSIAHIGSTAVPGLAAKPIVDIGILVEDIAIVDAHLDALIAGGYTLRLREPNHRMLRTAPHRVHVHCWAIQPVFERHLMFRDRLRASPQDRALYERVKRELSQREWASRDDYVKEKSKTIDAIMSRATVR
jgi:GrpB-like predicted nucleotidyltransferase (UPF0157 family)